MATLVVGNEKTDHIYVNANQPPIHHLSDLRSFKVWDRPFEPFVYVDLGL
jgi:hypothetical protein